MRKSFVRRRLLASLGDLAVIAAWLAGLGLVGTAARQGRSDSNREAPVSNRTLLVADAAVFAATVLPVGLYLATGEAGPRQASLGKRWLGLHVVDQHGHPASKRQIGVRTAVKLLPWQLAHLALARMLLGMQHPRTIWATYSASLAVPILSIAMALNDPASRALHDRVAHTQVVDTSRTPPGAR